MKESIIVFMLMLLPGSLLFSQVSVNSTGDPPHSSAMLDVSSTTKGLLPPRMTTAEMIAIPNPATGLMIFNLDINKPVFFDGNRWSRLDGQDNCGLPFTDSRDGKDYTTIQIGTQCWMAENLNAGVMIGGTIEQSDNGTIEKYCYNNEPDSCIRYGGLYQWWEMMQYTTTPSVQGICPDGWHLPSDAEWTTLTDYVSSWTGFWCGNPSYIGKALASKTNWNSSTEYCAVGNDPGSNNATGFSGLPGGTRNSSGNFLTVGGYGYWWTSTEIVSNFAWYCLLYCDYPELRMYPDYEENGFSVRCLRD